MIDQGRSDDPRFACGVPGHPDGLASEQPVFGLIRVIDPVRSDDPRFAFGVPGHPDGRATRSAQCSRIDASAQAAESAEVILAVERRESEK
ncbi:MAG: hypothetical protein ACF8LL_12435, partial [Phycisphaerales bacterium]